MTTEPDVEVVGDRYELREKLGAGTSGAVWKAFDRSLGRFVAIKLMHQAPDPEGVRRFLREVKVATRFRHPDIIELYEAGEVDGRPYLVMELVTSPTLAQAIFLGRDPPSAAAVIEVGRALASLLAATHDAGLVHRDLKPANVFVEGPLAALQRCRLGDFGLAFMLQPETATMGRLTLEAVMVGTPFYMSPEQAAAGEVGVAADIYSLGCMLHELATGRPPFVGNLARIIAGHTYLPPVPLCELDPDMPKPLEQLVLAMLAKVPAERPTAREVVDRLVALAAAGTGPVRPRSAWQPRLARSVGTTTLGESTVDQPRDDDEAPVIAVEVDAPDLVTELRAHGVAIDGAAPIVVVAFGSLSAETAGDPRGRLALHPAPTANDLAHAIRHGADGVVRWPGPLAPILHQIQRTTQHRRRGRAR